MEKWRCNFWNFRSPVTFSLTLDRVKAISACTIYIILSECPTMWLYPEGIQKYGHLKFKVWSHMIAFLEGNLKIGLRKAVDPILSSQTISIELSIKMAKEIDPEECNVQNFRSPVTLTFHRVKVTLVRISSRGLPMHQIRSKLEKLFVDRQTDVHTDGRTHQSSVKSIRSSPGYDLKIKMTRNYAIDKQLNITTNKLTIHHWKLFPTLL